MLELSCGFEECNAMRIVPTDAIKVKLSASNLQDFLSIDLKLKAFLELQWRV